MPSWLIAIALLSAGGTGMARMYAIGRRLVDEPGARRSHAEATPRGGGVGIVATCLVAFGWIAYMHRGDAWGLAFTAAGLALVAAIGWWDDHRPLPPPVRLAVHGVAGLILVHASGLWALSPWVAVAGLMATLVLINVWNFMDGINGIAASQAALVGAAAAWVLSGQAAMLGGAVAAASIGFLPWNFPRARIFMGDVGSGSLGYLVAALLLAALPGTAPVAMLLLAASAFLIDAGLTLLRRMARRERWWEPHTQHLFQLLARRAGHARVTLAYAVWTLVALAFGLSTARAGTVVTLSSVTVWYIAGALLWLWLQRPAAWSGGEFQERDR